MWSVQILPTGAGLPAAWAMSSSPATMDRKQGVGASISELSSLPHGADKALEAMSVTEPLTLFKAHCLWAEGEAMERGWSSTPGTPQQWNEPCHRAGSSPQLGVVGCSLGCKFRWFRWPPVCPMALKCFHSLLSAMSHRRSSSRLQCFYDCIVLNYFMWYKEDQGALPVIDISPSSPLVTHIYFNVGFNKLFCILVLPFCRQWEQSFHLFTKCWLQHISSDSCVKVWLWEWTWYKLGLQSACPHNRWQFSICQGQNYTLN